MSLDWQHLRTWNGSQANAFEELCCQLAGSETAPANSKFTRKGTPDGGVECYWKLPNGDEWGWQAKFFLAAPSASQWGELDRSIKTALTTHPRLKRFYVCLPLNRSDARLPGHVSFLDRWNVRVKKWKKLPGGWKVQFEYWGDHEIANALALEQHKGRNLFWFNKQLFSDAWFAAHLKVATAQAGERYTEPVSVELPISRVFDGLGRTDAFWARLRKSLLELRKRLRDDLTRSFPDSMKATAKKLGPALSAVFEAANNLREDPAAELDYAPVRQAVAKAKAIVSDLWGRISEQETKWREEYEKKHGKPPSPYETGLGDAWHQVQSVGTELGRLEGFMDTPDASVSEGHALLITGEAGSGKTHLVCDAAVRRQAFHLPSLVFFGEQFAAGDPWTTMIHNLGLACSRDEFLGALSASAQARNRRILVFIDALNEGSGLEVWPAHLSAVLATFVPYKYLGVCITVRDSYREIVIPPGLVPARVHEITHHGFSQVEFTAIKRFFAYYGIEQPSVPTLTPEFTNPLFLKLFCTSVKNRGFKKVPKGVAGITAVFGFFLESVNLKLSHPGQLDYDKADNLVLKCVVALADEMARTGQSFVTRDFVKAKCEQLRPAQGHEKSLFRRLVSEGVLSEGLRRGDHDVVVQVVRFAYQRFGDHLVAQRLLAQSAGRAASQILAPDSPAGVFLKDLHDTYLHSGLVDALSIQLPEKIQIEFLDARPDLAESNPVREAFVASLGWRDPKSFSAQTLKHVNTLSNRSTRGRDEILNVFLMVTGDPGHPYNADFLHKYLGKMELAVRDAVWSTFLHRNYAVESGVDRLLEWSWSDDDRSHIDDESIRLAGTTISWFLTSSNRFVRDRATKALVSLFENRLLVLAGLLRKFANVNDPYVSERLYAVAYGCGLRTKGFKDLGILGKQVFSDVFAKGRPPPSLLLRDHARGLVNVASLRCPRIRFNLRATVGPFRTPWIGRLPSLAQLEKKYKKEEQYNRVYHSVTGDDFSHYVIDSTFDWCSHPLSKPKRRDRKKEYEDFVASLGTRARLLFEAYEQAFQETRPLWAFIRKDTDTESQATRDARCRRLRRAVVAALTKKASATFENDIVPYLINPRVDRDADHFDRNLMRRFILQRVLELGWTAKRFAEFDRSIRDPRGRDAYKAERIGKKYQWIAYDEFLARVSDNFHFKESDGYRTEERERETGVWAIYYRDIDPSLLLRTTATQRDENGPKPWWVQKEFTDWASNIPPEKWLKRTGDLPPVDGFIQCIDPGTGIPMLMLNGCVKWEQEEEVGDFAIKAPDKRSVWYMLRSYLVRKEHLAEIMKWGKGQDFMGRWMPEPSRNYRVYLHENYLPPVYQKDGDWGDNESSARGRIPKPIVCTTGDYLCEKSTRDCSMDETIAMDLPSQHLYNGMKLAWSGRDGIAVDASSKVVAFDPSVFASGPTGLLMAKEPLLRFLKTKGYEIFWTLLCQKDIDSPDPFAGESKWVGRLDCSGVYQMKNGKIVGSLTPKFVPPFTPKLRPRRPHHKSG